MSSVFCALQNQLNRLSHWVQYRYWLQVCSGLFLVVLFAVVGGVYLKLSDYTANLYTEFLGIIITILVLNVLAKRRDMLELRAQLLREMASRDNSIAIRALEEFKARGWVNEGYLTNQNLERANLDTVDLHEAELNGINLAHAHLRNAKLRKAVIKNAKLQQVDLRAAQLQQTDLERSWLYKSCLENAQFLEAILHKAILQGACLAYANLEGAKLQGANLRGANLSGALINNKTEFDYETVLPDGMLWTEDIDMSQFTHKNELCDIEPEAIRIYEAIGSPFRPLCQRCREHHFNRGPE